MFHTDLKTKPKVSVIIPNYNHARYLKKRIESILDQTYQDFELILLDDCSTDNSKTIINQYKDHPKISHIIYNRENSGSTFKQWKKGIELSAGEYIWIAESDDYCEKDILQTLIDGITIDKDCVISYCQSFIVNEKDEIQSQSSHWMPSEIIDGRTYIQKHLSISIALHNASMALWRRDKFKYVPDLLTTFRFNGDVYFWIQLCKHGKVHVSTLPLNYFRTHSQDVSSKSLKSGLNFREELMILDLSYEEGLIDEKLYRRAYKKKFIQFWQIRKEIEKQNIPSIYALFRSSLSPAIKLSKLIPIAIWTDFSRPFKKK